MELSEFYRAVLPPTGHYALFNSKKKQHVWFKTIDELVAGTLKRSAAPSWYFATSSFIGEERKQEQVSGKKCFYIDIDAGAEKFKKHPASAWPTIQDATRALSAFIADTKLTPSIIVSSGGGLHVYWVLNEVIEEKAWFRAAEALKRISRAKGLRADPACTSDSARVLRAIGSTHHDDVKVRLLRATEVVYGFSEFKARLEAVTVVEEQVAIPVPEGQQVTFAGFEDVDNDFKQFEPIPTSALKIKEKCGAIAEIVENPTDAPEPIWRGMIGLVKHCVEGATIAHEWSKGHPSYDFIQTQEKFDRYAAGPTLCESFAAYSSKCSACPHNGKIKSPIILGRITIEDEKKPEVAALMAEFSPPESKPKNSVPGIPEGSLGAGYKCELAGGKPVLYGKLIKLVKEENGETTKVVVWVPFTEDVFWLKGWTEAGRHDNQNSMLALVLHRRGRVQAFDLANETTADRKALLKYLNSKSINPINYNPETTQMIQQYVNDQIRRVKGAASKPVIRDHLGFHMDSNGDLYCAQGKYLIMKDGLIRECLLDRTLDTVKDAVTIDGLVDNPTGEWSKDAWKDISQRAKKQIEFYRKWWSDPELEVAQLAIMLQLAGPLLVFAAPTDMAPDSPLPAIGLTVSLFSTNSGKGKTSIQTVATYAYGEPAALIRQGDRLGMTFNAQIAIAAALGTMPFPMDEVTTNDPQQVSESINRIASGMEKVRANKEGGISRPPVSWALVSTVSTNVPQRELVASYQKGSDALQMRMIELDCDQLPTRNAESVPEYDEALRTAMNDTRGSLGGLIHLYCVTHGYKVMREKVLANLSRAAIISPGESKERFILRAIAVVMTLMDIMDHYKAPIFSRDAIMRQSVLALESARKYMHNDTNEGPLYLFLRMVREMSPAIAITDEDVSNTDPAVLQNETKVKTPFAGRICKKSGLLYLSVEAMNEWCTTNLVSASNILRFAAANNFIQQFSETESSRMINLANGIRTAFMPKTRCIKLLLSSLREINNSGGNVVELRRADSPSPEAPATATN